MLRKPLIPQRFCGGLRRFRRPIVVGLAAVAALAVFALIGVPLSSAQNITPDALRALQQHQGTNDPNDDDNSTVRPSVQNYPPIKIPLENLPPSRLELLYLERSGQKLQQFGYASLGVPSAVAITQAGSIPDSYVLGQGDELFVTLRGQENSSYRFHIDRDGLVTLPKLSPILAAGRRFGDFRADLEAQVSQAFMSTKAFVTLGSVHELTILVSGEVRAPGSRIVSGLASPLDVILLSGGIKKTGSLRNVQVIRGGVSHVVDLYSVVAQGRSASLGSLRDGDRVYVPPIGATAAVSGNVSRPAIFELPAGTSSTNVATLLHLAGGVEIAGSYTLAKLGVRHDGVLDLVPVSPNGIVRSGEVLVVSASHGGTVGRIWLKGAIPNEGVRPLSANPTVSDLFASATDLQADAYTPFAVIKRRDPVTNAATLVPISLTAAIRRTASVTLRDEDTIYVFTRAQMLALASKITLDQNSAYDPSRQPETTQAEPPSPQSPAQSPSQSPDRPDQQPAPGTIVLGASGDGLARANPNAAPLDNSRLRGGDATSNVAAAALAQSENLSGAVTGAGRAQPSQEQTDERTIASVAAALDVRPEALLRIATDNLVWVLDAVRLPGPYVAAKGTSVADMIQAAGGVQQSADLSTVEVTSTAVDQQNGTTQTSRDYYNQNDGQMTTISIRPMDVIRLRPVYSAREGGTVTVVGQVRYPGVFDITRHERLSSLLERAGGITEVGYPYGAIFTRKSVALLEKAGNEREAREIESQIPGVLQTQASAQGQGASIVQYLTSLATSLRKMPMLGRIAVAADPTVLATRPELDVLLEPGDALYIPKRPSTVTVSGEVLSPGSFQFKAGLGYADYVRLAGGYTQSAEEGRTFIVNPDGTATPIESDWLSFGGGGHIPPGSTIIVPRDLRPFDWIGFIKDVTQIASQLAVSAASLAVLQNN